MKHFHGQNETCAFHKFSVFSSSAAQVFTCTQITQGSRETEGSDSEILGHRLKVRLPRALHTRITLAVITTAPSIGQLLSAKHIFSNLHEESYKVIIIPLPSLQIRKLKTGNKFNNLLVALR